MDITQMARDAAWALRFGEMGRECVKLANEKTKGVIEITDYTPRVNRDKYMPMLFYVLYLCCVMNRYKIRYRIMPKSAYDEDYLMVIFMAPGHGNSLYFFPLGEGITMEYYK